MTDQGDQGTPQRPDPEVLDLAATQEDRSPAGDAAPTPDPMRDAPSWLHLGRQAWATLGILGILVVAVLVLGQLMLLVVPLTLALFPAALLMPVTNLLRRLGLPASLASILTIIAIIGLVAGAGTALAPVISDEIPNIVESVEEGLEAVDDFLAEDHLGLGVTRLGDVVDRARERLVSEDGEDGDGGVGGDAASGAMAALTVLFEGVTAFLLLLVALFFYLKDGPRLAAGVVRTLPASWQAHASEIGGRVWYTTGAYFRGQLLVALADAVFIGIGLVLLGIPLALPLAVLVFFGGLFPIVGAVVTGFIAVLVALADAGIMRALAVALLVLAVQQTESNVLEPFILSKVIRLHPLVVLSSIAAGAILLGVLGAFLAVPIAASIARSVDYLRFGDHDHSEAAEASSSDVDTYAAASSRT